MALIDEWSGCLPLPSLADSKFHNYSTTANLVASSDNFPSPEKELLNHSQRTMPELPKQETIVAGKSERQIADIATRFKSIQRIFLQHSTKQSSAHESRLDLKRMDLDWSQLSSDLANKMSIAQDLKFLVDKLQQNPTQQTHEMVESKFQEYYLERHYGGLTCDIHDLNIEQRQSSKCLKSDYIESSHPISSISKCGQSEQSIQYINLNLHPQSRAALSNLGCVSLVNQSNYSQGNYHSVTIQVPRIIEIEIPIIVYKLKERKVGLEESQLGGLGGDLDEIIDRFSKPYEDLYFGWKDQQKAESGLMLQTRTQKDMTDVELSYSQFPGEQLPLDSYAQIGSLISNPEVSRVVCHDLPTSTIIITEKINSKSVLQKFEQTQRALIDQNAELRETITLLQQSIVQYEQKILDMQKKSEKLQSRLEQQILYGQCLQRQIQKLDSKSYQQKIENITKLQSETFKRNEIITRQLEAKILQLQMAKNELQQMKIVGEKTEQLLSQREEELMILSKQLQEQQEEIYRLDNCGEDLKQFVSSSETGLKREIQKLESEKGQLSLQLKQLKKIIQQEGLSLGYQEAKQIQGIIEERQYLFKIELKQVQEKYAEMANSYKNQSQQLQKIKEQLELRIQTQKQERQKEKLKFNTYVEDFKDIIEDYHRQLELKDNQILQLKQQKLHFDNKFGSIDHQQNLTITLYQTIELLKEQLQKQHQQRQKILQTMISLQKTISISPNDNLLRELQLATNLVQQLSHKLEIQITQNQSLQNRFTQQTQSFSEKQKLEKQNLSLRKANCKLKRYTKQLQNELLTISGMSRCQSHSAIIKLVSEERDYYRDLPTL